LQGINTLKEVYIYVPVIPDPYRGGEISAAFVCKFPSPPIPRLEDSRLIVSSCVGGRVVQIPVLPKVYRSLCNRHLDADIEKNKLI
jgi:hypothetical protein